MLRHLTLVLLMAVSLVGGGLLGIWGFLQLDDATLPGLRVAGGELVPTDRAEEEIGQRAAAWLEVPVRITVAGEPVTTTRRELGMSIDVSALARHAARLGHSGDPVDDLRVWWAARRGEIDLPFEPAVDRDVLASHLALLSPFVDRSPREAVFDLEARVANPGQDGARLDLSASVDAVAAALAEGDDAELVVESLPMPDGAALPEGLRLDTTLARWTTRYRSSGGNRSRAHNVELATSRLNGVVVPAGGVVSFNDRVGPRTGRAGFRRAHVISGGEIVDGMGGGVCQVASTLHAAALHAGMEMVDYRPHSRPSTYIPMGLDATVVYPVQDLKIENPFDFPVVVAASASDGEVRVEILGAERPREVEVERRVLGRAGFGERVVEDQALARGTRVISQQGIRGARVERVRTIHEGGETFADRTVVRYPPTARIVRVGTGEPDGREPSVAPVGTLALR